MPHANTLHSWTRSAKGSLWRRARLCGEICLVVFLDRRAGRYGWLRINRRWRSKQWSQRVFLQERDALRDCWDQYQAACLPKGVA